MVPTIQRQGIQIGRWRWFAVDPCAQAIRWDVNFCYAFSWHRDAKANERSVWQGAVLFELIQFGKRKRAIDPRGLRSPGHAGVIAGRCVHAGAI